MARWTPLKSDVLEAVGAELVQHNPEGRVTVAVRGPSADEARGFAEELAQHTPRPAVVAESVTLEPVIQLVHGPATDESTPFHSIIWLHHEGADDYIPAHAATIVVDVTDPEHPRQTFADAC